MNVQRHVTFCHLFPVDIPVEIIFMQRAPKARDIIMTCSWSDALINKRVVWFRKRPGSPAEFIHVFVQEGDQIINTTNSEMRDKFEPIEQDNYFREYKLALLDASDDDEGDYWCALNVTANKGFNSSAKALTVIGKNFHSVYQSYQRSFSLHLFAVLFVITLFYCVSSVQTKREIWLF